MVKINIISGFLGAGKTTLTVTVEGTDISASAVISVIPGKVKITTVKSGKKKFNVSWESVDGATKYQVAYSATKSFKQIRKKTTKKTSSSRGWRSRFSPSRR